MTTHSAIAPSFDLLLKDLTVLTGDPQQPLITDAAIGIVGSQLAYVGKVSSLPKNYQAKRTLSLPDRVVTPGLVNVHTHAILTMVRGVAEDLGFAPAYTPGIPHGHDVSPDEARALARLGALEAMQFGSTLINDTYVHADLTMEAMAELGLRVYSCGRIHDVDFSGVADSVWNHHDAIGEKTLNEALELAQRWRGKYNGRTGVQLAAHAPDTCSDRFLKSIAQAAAEHDLRVTTHLAQSKTEVAQIRRRSNMTPAELLEDVGLLNHRLTAAHCLYMTESDIARAGRAAITVAHIPKGNATGGTMAPTPQLRAAGAHLALGTDNMHADMVEVMRWALAIGRIQVGAVNSDWQPADVLQMATINGARAMGLEDKIGSLVVCKQADLVVFDFRRAHLTPAVNPLGNIVHVGQGRDVELVLVDGVIVVEGGTASLVDAEKIRQEAKQAAKALWARAS